MRCFCLSKHKKTLRGVVTVANWNPFMQKWLDYWKKSHLKYDWPKWMAKKRKSLPQSSMWPVFPHLNSLKMAIGKTPPIFLVMHSFVWCIWIHYVTCSINTSSYFVISTGKRTVKGITRWLERHTGPSATVLNDVKSAEALLDANDVVVVGFFQVNY